ncbi:alternative ribosome rescue aminoacyl-tRNA hydrolase ArfB [Flavobacterium sp. '19STA2R22 D10 B1']|uniref:alternative ribosome rescue aminoacyl-tRNA hydrolase ArfB n=1 Tax=Flavobacterium aerium TaxID=3037261 RepID=UPI00278BD205|nr:alternative ribosome rescue aminoacyl-tRNA hydrolase ArfB [Flavobacterium sp. '19STA2R22 D10 B1']
MDQEKIISELQFKAVRSSGPGGQNVNKVSSKVVLSFDLKNSNALTEEEKNLIENKLTSKLTNEQVLILNCDEDRSQIKNKEIVIKRFLKIIEAALIIPKIRKATKPSRAAVKKRIQLKQSQSLKKEFRKKPRLE